MKKQVTFAQRQTFQRLHCDDALPSINPKSDSRTGFKSDDKIHQLPRAYETKGLRDTSVIRIPKIMTAAPFLQHTTLTPAQRAYLYSIAAANKAAHVRNLITQHYINVLHRCVPSVGNYKGNLNGTSHTSEVDHHSTHSVESFRSKKRTGSRNTRMCSLPRIPHKPTSTSKQRKVKKHLPYPALRSSPKRHRSRSQEQEEENMEDFLSECLSSLYVGDIDESLTLEL